MKVKYLFIGLLLGVLITILTSKLWLLEVQSAEVTKNSHKEELTTRDWVIERLYKEDSIDPIKAVKIIDCESSFNPQAVHGNKDGSVDIGLWMINNKLYTDISNTDKLDYKKSTEYAIALIKKHKGFSPWICNHLIK